MNRRTRPSNRDQEPQDLIQGQLDDSTNQVQGRKQGQDGPNHRGRGRGRGGDRGRSRGGKRGNYHGDRTQQPQQLYNDGRPGLIDYHPQPPPPLLPLGPQPQPFHHQHPNPSVNQYRPPYVPHPQYTGHRPPHHGNQPPQPLLGNQQFGSQYGMQPQQNAYQQPQQQSGARPKQVRSQHTYQDNNRSRMNSDEHVGHVYQDSNNNASRGRGGPGYIRGPRNHENRDNRGRDDRGRNSRNRDSIGSEYTDRNNRDRDERGRNSRNRDSIGSEYTERNNRDRDERGRNSRNRDSIGSEYTERNNRDRDERGRYNRDIRGENTTRENIELDNSSRGNRGKYIRDRDNRTRDNGNRGRGNDRSDNRSRGQRGRENRGREQRGRGQYSNRQNSGRGRGTPVGTGYSDRRNQDDSDASIYDDSDLESWVSEATTVADLLDVVDNFNSGCGGRGMGRGRGGYGGRRPYKGHPRAVGRGAGSHSDTRDNDIGTSHRGNRQSNRGRGNFERGRRGNPGHPGAGRSPGPRGGRYNKNRDSKDADYSGEDTDGSTDDVVSGVDPSEPDKAGAETVLVDVKDMKLTTLKNRMKRYKKKIGELVGKGAEQSEIGAIKEQLVQVQTEVTRRNKAKARSERKMNDKANNEKSVVNNDDQSEHEESDDGFIILTDSESNEEREIAPKIPEQRRNRKLQSSMRRLGAVGFKPKSLKKTANAKKLQTEASVETNASKTRSTARQTSKLSTSEEAVNSTDDSQEAHKDGQTKQAAKKRKRGRKKKESYEEVEPVADDKAVDRELLSQFYDDLMKQSDRQSEVIEAEPTKVIEAEPTEVVSQTNLKQKTQDKQPHNAPVFKAPVPKHKEVPIKPLDLNNSVFKFVVDKFDGKGDPHEIQRESGLFPTGCNVTNWFKSSKLFNNIIRDGKVICALAFLKDISYCLDYIKVAGCTKGQSCSRFHVCKDLLCGHCVFGDKKCKFSHNLLDEYNRRIANRLGLVNVFSSEEICTILSVRYPHICSSWQENGTCPLNQTCPDLHMCPRYILAKCLDDNCTQGHDRHSHHNSPIVEAFHMSSLQDSIFRRMVYLRRTGDLAEQDKTANLDADILKTDKAGELLICEEDLLGTCNNIKSCPRIHNKDKLPYIWQLKEHPTEGEWRTLDAQEDIEKAYCKISKHDSYSGTSYRQDSEEGVFVEIHFNPLRATIDQTTRALARRLSTVSYKHGGSPTHNPHCFRTQWRWYWVDDYRNISIFDQELMQHTLEEKFLAKQRDYHFPRSNYKFLYNIDFTEMTQCNIETGTKRKLHRRPLFVSKSDVRTCQFPGCLQAPPEIPVELPATWVPWDLVHPFELVELSKDDECYRDVSTNFFKTMGNNRLIDSIFRMQNYDMWSKFCIQQKSMIANKSRDGRGVAVDMVPLKLYHGTGTLDAVRGISTNNFDFRLSQNRLYGDGAYFARDAKYSHNYTSSPKRFIFQTLVLLDDYTLGKKDYRLAPVKPNKAHERYDACVDTMDNPSIYVVFEKSQHYPEYLIQYHDEMPANLDIDYDNVIAAPRHPVPVPRRSRHNPSAERTTSPLSTPTPRDWSPDYRRRPSSPSRYTPSSDVPFVHSSVSANRPSQSRDTVLHYGYSATSPENTNVGSFTDQTEYANVQTASEPYVATGVRTQTSPTLAPTSPTRTVPRSISGQGLRPKKPDSGCSVQ